LPLHKAAAQRGGPAGVETKASPQQKLIKILAFGDSLTAGYRLAPSQAYPALIEKALNEEGYKAQVVNAGVSGDTSAQGLRRVKWNLKQGPFDYVLLGLGANDGLRNIPTPMIEKNLRELIETFEATKAQVLLLGMKLPTNLDAKYRTRFEAIYPKLAREEKIPLVPFLLEGVAADPNLNLDDQIHPNAKGQALVARNILRVLETLVKKDSAHESHLRKR
jgi:acyl-CoA thioesterase-1